MAGSVPLDDFRAGYEAFRDAAEAVPPALFVAPMGEGHWSPGLKEGKDSSQPYQASAWSAHDTVAHLAGWNREMIQAGRDLLAGKTPYYYSERAIDYRDMNARFVAMYAAQDKLGLMTELAATEAELEGFAQGLDPAELEADHGVVHYRGGPATVRTVLDSLGRDYRHHAEEIRAWLAGQSVK